jgi:hypothetical protein
LLVRFCKQRCLFSLRLFKTLAAPGTASREAVKA